MENRGRAERIWRRARLAVDALRERSRQLGIRANQVNRDSLYLSGNVLDRAALLREAEARRRAGFNTTFLERREVKARFGVRGRSALLSYDNFSANPRLLATGFLAAAIARGTEVLVRVERCGVCHSDLHMQDGYFRLGADRRASMTVKDLSTGQTEVVPADPGVLAQLEHDVNEGYFEAILNGDGFSFGNRVPPPTDD